MRINPKMEELIWKWDWSAGKAKAYVTDGNGYIVVGPMLSAESARKLVSEHNRLIAMALENSLEDIQNGVWIY